MKPEDIVTAIHAAGATIATDGEHISVSPPKLVQPIIMQAAKDAKPALLSHLIETGRVSADGVEAAGARRRLVKGLPMLEAMEEAAETETPKYTKMLTFFETVLRQYERFCDAARETVTA